MMNLLLSYRGVHQLACTFTYAKNYRVDILLLGLTRYQEVPSLIPLYLPPWYGSGTI
jgi:hypothetical protein